MTARWLAAALLIAAMAPGRASHACASCGCGDPTLTALGSEKPFANRLRVGGQVVVQGETSGTPRLDQIALREQRLDLQAAWAPSPRLFLLASLPLVRREVSYVNLARRRARGVGDLELRGKLFLWEDRSFSPRHLLSATVGARLPTTPWARDDQGTAWPSELQIGSGAWTPLAGLGYAHFHYPWSEYASLEASAPLAHQPAYRPAPGLRGTAAVQRQLGSRVAASVSVDARADGHAREAGRPDPNTGGALTFASPALLVTPAPDLVIYLLARFPVVDGLAGDQTAAPIFSVGVAYDL